MAKYILTGFHHNLGHCKPVLIEENPTTLGINRAVQASLNLPELVHAHVRQENYGFHVSYHDPSGEVWDFYLEPVVEIREICPECDSINVNAITETIAGVEFENFECRDCRHEWGDS